MNVLAFEYVNSKGKKYFLHSKEVVLKNGHKQQIYYFARAVKHPFAKGQLPENRVIMERNGFPLLKKA